MPFSYLPQGGGPPSRGSSADAEDRTPPPNLPPSPFVHPPDTKMFTPSNTYNFTMEALQQHSALSGKHLLMTEACYIK